MACLRPLGLFLIMPLLESKNIGGSLIRNSIIMLLVVPIYPAIDASNALIEDNAIGFPLFW